MRSAVLTLNFGEPEHPTEEEIVPFLERIFYANARLEDQPSDQERRARSRELALGRAPGLLEDYRAIGGSPLNAQARAHAEALAAELAHRGRDVPVFSAMQFTDPLIPTVLEEMRGAGIDRIVALPGYPLCGHSTTVAALDQVDREIGRMGWDVEVRPISGWHPHPEYIRIRADGIRRMAVELGADWASGDDLLLFSAHGTPIRYLDEGSGYNDYVLESCRAVAGAAGVPNYLLGYQNHANRRIPWTEPDVDEVVRGATGRRVVVVPISFMHEQSETLAELDQDLREVAEGAGLEFHRVPVPHDDPRFASVLADLVEPHLPDGSSGSLEWGSCRCRPRGGTRCLNAVGAGTRI